MVGLVPVFFGMEQVSCLEAAGKMFSIWPWGITYGEPLAKRFFSFFVGWELVDALLVRMLACSCSPARGWLVGPNFAELEVNLETGIWPKCLPSKSRSHCFVLLFLISRG